MSNVVPFPRSAAKPTVTLAEMYALLIQHAAKVQHDPKRDPVYREAAARLLRGVEIRLKGAVQC